MDPALMARWQTLVDRFEFDKPGLSPWNASTLLDAHPWPWSHGETLTVQFLLNVWDPSLRHRVGVFDIVEAYGVWDEIRTAAFLAWANNPFFP